MQHLRRQGGERNGQGTVGDQQTHAGHVDPEVGDLGGRAGHPVLAQLLREGALTGLLGHGTNLRHPGRLAPRVVFPRFRTAHGAGHGMAMMGAFIAVAPPSLVFVAGSHHFLSDLTEDAVKMRGDRSGVARIEDFPDRVSP